MGEMSSEGSHLSAGIDLSQFYQVFFEEAGENLDRMEQLLLELNVESADDEELNAIFRCAHSIKGGAATFGFKDVAELTHQMETLLDKLRRHELEPTSAMVDVLLQSGDALRAQPPRHRGNESDELDTTELLFNIRAMSSGTAPAVKAPPVVNVPIAAPSVLAEPVNESAARVIELRVGPLDKPEQADELVELFKEIADLGTIEPLDNGMPADGMRRFKICTTSSDSDLLDLFTFHVTREQVALLPLGPGFGFHKDAPGAPPEEAPDPGYGFF